MPRLGAKVRRPLPLPTAAETPSTRRPLPPVRGPRGSGSSACPRVPVAGPLLGGSRLPAGDAPAPPRLALPAPDPPPEAAAPAPLPGPGPGTIPGHGVGRPRAQPRPVPGPSPVPGGGMLQSRLHSRTCAMRLQPRLGPRFHPRTPGLKPRPLPVPGSSSVPCSVPSPSRRGEAPFSRGHISAVARAASWSFTRGEDSWI